MKYHMRIRKDGVIEWLSPPPGFSIPVLKQTRTRFSEILPVNPFQRVVFRLLRMIYGEEGPVANWTRSWNIKWECRILLGPKRGMIRTSRHRYQLINWEHNQWAANLRNQ